MSSSLSLGDELHLLSPSLLNVVGVCVIFKRDVGKADPLWEGKQLARHCGPSPAFPTDTTWTSGPPPALVSAILLTLLVPLSVTVASEMDQGQPLLSLFDLLPRESRSHPWQRPEILGCKQKEAMKSYMFCALRFYFLVVSSKCSYYVGVEKRDNTAL